MSGPSSDTVRKHLAAERQLPELPPGTHARILSRVRATAATPPASLVASASGLGTKLVLLVGGVVSAVAVAIMIGNAGGEIVSVPAPTPTATPAPTPTPTSALPERVLLDRAQSALAANDPASALAATREHSKHYTARSARNATYSASARCSRQATNAPQAWPRTPFGGASRARSTVRASTPCRRHAELREAPAPTCSRTRCTLRRTPHLGSTGSPAPAARARAPRTPPPVWAGEGAPAFWRSRRAWSSCRRA